MGPVHREVFTRFSEGRPVFPGFVSYLRRAAPVLMHRSGWVDESDTYDDFADSVSHDNGRSWSVPRPSLRSRETAEGRIRYAENACFFDADRERLHVYSSRALYPGDRHSPDTLWEVVEDEYDSGTDSWRGERPLGLGPAGGCGISFCFPIFTTRGTLLIPAIGKVIGEDGSPRHYPGCWAPLSQAFVVRGERRRDGAFSYTAGTPVRIDPESSSRGLSESALAELRDGRIVMVCRGDNSMYPDRPGYKWVCMSSDEGRTWSEPQPLGCDQGPALESGANGSALVRSQRSGRLYWIGNLCTRGERANGNWPRSPLVIAEVQEQPFALKRSTVAAIDERAESEPEKVQHSNFRFYQDRLTGELVLFLTRFGENDAKEWKRADYYRYRLNLD